MKPYFTVLAVLALMLAACTTTETPSNTESDVDTSMPTEAEGAEVQTTQQDSSVSPDPSNDTAKAMQAAILGGIGATTVEGISEALVRSMQQNDFLLLTDYFPDSSKIVMHYKERNRDLSTYGGEVFREQAIGVYNSMRKQWKDAYDESQKIGINWANVQIKGHETLPMPEAGVQYTLVRTELASTGKPYRMSIVVMPIGGKWFLGEKFRITKMD